MNKQPVQLIFADTNHHYLSSKTNWHDLLALDWEQVSYIAIDASDIDDAYEALLRIRQLGSANIYLRPLIFISRESKELSWKWKAADGVINFKNEAQIDWSFWAEQVESYNRWIKKLTDEDESVDGHLTVKILRMLVSRNLIAEPLATTDMVSGFIYPKLQPFFTLKDMGVVQMLAYLEKQQLLIPSFIDKAHFCNHCDSAFLNFKETCPQCHSHDLETLELIHHFKCAHTADITQFKQNDGSLVCPKCDQTLTHIGVDYDKPSTVNKCRTCSYVGQDSEVVAQCYQCGKKTNSEHLEVRRINRYNISSIGINAAYYGLDTYFTNILETELQLLSLREFELFTNIEAARIERYKKSESSLAIVQLIELEKVYLALGSKAKQVFSELASIFKAVFRESDVITAYNESIFAVLMTETSKDSADIALNRLSESVKQLFSQNFDSLQEVSTKSILVNAELDIKRVLDNFLNAQEN
ncbi:diguanylate cyclase domain-containing protein [Thalassotalea profundi]|uniref:Diguanylate cyclase n=1 Tax=Thalassotalea profundi TaxID=2036687 RepID=A0ABQ3IR35_9GAMM|nr:diguanylate cyclase [Thalassotalea profundi]GHE88330.1 diguanylate cyclase [Thalassotalea profundi]